MNDVTLNKVLNMIDNRDQGWKLIKSEDGIDVYRKFTSNSNYACVRCSGIINATSNEVFSLFEDNTRVAEYNSFFEAGRDLEIVAENTKVTWACTPPVFPFKARDFCTVVHFRQLQDGTIIVLNRATNHPGAPVSNKFVRGSIILAANIIQPIPGKPNACKLTMITQMDPGGFAPAFFVNKVCSLGPIGFMKNVNVAAKRKPSRKVMKEKKDIANIQRNSKQQTNKMMVFPSPSRVSSMPAS